MLQMLRGKRCHCPHRLSLYTSNVYWGAGGWERPPRRASVSAPHHSELVN